MGVMPKKTISDFRDHVQWGEPPRQRMFLEVNTPKPIRRLINKVRDDVVAVAILVAYRDKVIEELIQRGMVNHGPGGIRCSYNGTAIRFHWLDFCALNEKMGVYPHIRGWVRSQVKAHSQMQKVAVPV